MKKALALFLVCAVLAAGGSVFAASKTDVFGFRVFAVLTASMSPTVNKGDLILVKDTPPEKVRVGDIVTFNASANPDMVVYITHRVVQITETTLIARGDNNAAADPPVSKDQLIGKVILVVPRAGNILLWVQRLFRLK